MDNEDQKLDVEKIIDEIRASADSAEAQITDEFKDSIVREQAIYSSLKGMNESCAAGAQTSGILSPLRRLIYFTIAPLLSDINEFHAHTVRVMNQLMRILEGKDTTLSGEMAEKNKKRIELLTQLSSRLEQYDQMMIEDRLKSLEDKIDTLKSDRL